MLPISVGDSRTFHQAVAASSMHDVMSMAQAGRLDFGFLGAAQIDPFGNINTTVIGEHDHPTARLPGSGGANDVGSFCHRTIIIMRQDQPQVRDAARLPDHTRLSDRTRPRDGPAYRPIPARSA